MKQKKERIPTGIAWCMKHNKQLYSNGGCEDCWKQVQPPQKEGWEKELNKWYGLMFECGDYEALVDFIRKLLASQRQEINNSWLHQKANEHDKRIREDERQKVEEMEKAYGNCHKCYGKAYSTGTGSFASDGKPIPIVEYCDCQRGKQLKKFVEEQVQLRTSEGGREG